MVTPKKGFFQKRKERIQAGIGLSYLMNAGQYVSDVARGFLNIPNTEQRESFAQAVSRMHLTEQDLANRHKRFLQQFFLFLFCSFITLAYCIYLFTEGAWAAGVVVILMTGILIIYALRAHFWAFQIKHRKLGCTWKEWWSNQIEEEKKDLIKK